MQFGTAAWCRTTDLLTHNQALSRLSYGGMRNSKMPEAVPGAVCVRRVAHLTQEQNHTQ